MSSPPRSRAADVLRRLDQGSPAGSSEGSDAGLIPDRSAEPERSALLADDTFLTGDRHRRFGAGQLAGWRDRLPRSMSMIAAGVVALLVLVALVVARRPAPIEDRLPVAGEQSHAAQSDGAGAAGPTDPPTDPVAPVDGDAVGSSGPVAADVVVHVVGAVARPGVVRLAADARAVDAVEAAGGLLPDADTARVNLAALLVDGQRVVVPAHGEELPEEPAAAGPPSGATSSGASGTAGPGPSPGTASGGSALVDLNSATAEQLDTLPGVGPATASAIVGHRDENGPFGSVDELIDVRGIGEAKLEGLRDLVTVGRSRS